ncbi:MAG: DMT family transporter [Thermodesulfobacteriota bacterium]
MAPVTRQGKAYACALATVALWSTVASAFKLTLRHLTPPELLLYSSLASCLALAGILAAQGRLSLLRTAGRRDWLAAARLGFLNPFLYYLVLFWAYDLLPAQEAQPLNYTWAVTLSLLAAPLLGQKLRAADLLALLTSYAGVVVISTRGDLAGLSFASPLGVGLALGSTVIWALYWVLNTRDARDPVAGLLQNFLFGTLFVLAANLALGLRVPDWRGLAGAAYVGVFEMGLTFALWLTALKLTESAARVANLIFLSPLVSLFLINALVGETILPSTYWGLGLILMGQAVQRLAPSRV